MRLKFIETIREEYNLDKGINSRVKIDFLNFVCEFLFIDKVKGFAIPFAGASPKAPF